MAKIIAVKGNYHFVDYGCGYWSVDYVSESLGMTMKQSDNYQEVKDYFDSLNENKIPE